MGDRFYGVVIRCRHLNAMRVFLGETVGLGAPVVDSNIWLEYQLPGCDMILAVEQDDTAQGDRDSAVGNVAWCLRVDDVSAFEKRMTESGFGPEGETQIPGQGRSLIFRDPEGNCFFVRDSDGSPA
ncbi:MAG: hypothetical protein RRC34_09310 [Lentisphaeria bacterium]|nr:hypothetical protein [Lentisphaeria bacterium]